MASNAALAGVSTFLSGLPGVQQTAAQGVRAQAQDRRAESKHQIEVNAYQRALQEIEDNKITVDKIFDDLGLDTNQQKALGFNKSAYKALGKKGVIKLAGDVSMWMNYQKEKGSFEKNFKDTGVEAPGFSTAVRQNDLADLWKTRKKMAKDKKIQSQVAPIIAGAGRATTSGGLTAQIAAQAPDALGDKATQATVRQFPERITPPGGGRDPASRAIQFINQKIQQTDANINPAFKRDPDEAIKIKAKKAIWEKISSSPSEQLSSIESVNDQFNRIWNDKDAQLKQIKETAAEDIRAKLNQSFLTEAADIRAEVDRLVKETSWLKNSEDYYNAIGDAPLSEPVKEPERPGIVERTIGKIGDIGSSLASTLGELLDNGDNKTPPAAPTQAAPATPNVSEEEKASAIKWARENPANPKARQILDFFGEN